MSLRKPRVCVLKQIRCFLSDASQHLCRPAGVHPQEACDVIHLKTRESQR